MELRGKNDLLELFRRNGVRIVLHGHDHRNAQYRRKSVRFLNGGGSVIDREGGGFRVNLLHLWPDGILSEIHRLPEQSGLPVRTAEIIERREITEPVAA